MLAFVRSSVVTARLAARPSLYRTFSVASFAQSNATPQAYVERLNDIQKDTNTEGIAVLTLNRPSAKNAIGQQLLAELEESIERVQYDRSTRVLIVRSLVPGTFCAGADLKERRSMSESQVDRFLTSLRRTFSALERLSVPTIAALDGLAMGGGMELALCADLRTASSSTDKLGLPETRLGIIPGAGGTYRMSKLIGPSRTKELVFTARLLNGQQAFDLGIVDRLAQASASSSSSSSSSTAAFDLSVEVATAMAQNGPVALRAAKAAIDKAQILDTESGLDWERACYERCLRTKDRLEGLKAFAEKRKPQYVGE